MEIHVLPLHPQLNEVGGERRLSFFFFFCPRNESYFIDS